MPDPHLRAADADRAAVATVLGRHMAEGRLTVDEYDERLARAYAARTYGELAELTTDLPSLGRSAGTQPVPRDVARAGACGPMAGYRGWGGHAQSAWRSWLSTAIIVSVIWAITSISAGGFSYFWPIWVIGPWGAVLLAQTINGGHGKRREHYRSR